LAGGGVTGGGGGISIKQKMTPYPKNMRQHVNKVKDIKKKSHSKRIAEIPSIGTCQYIYFYYDRYGEATKPEVFIRGVNLDTDRYEKIHFGEIETVEILESRPPYETIILVKIFPNITPETLIETKPTYSELVDRNTLLKKMRVTTNKYSDLSFRLKINCTENSDASKAIFFDEIMPGTIIKFSFNLKKQDAPIWWAIDSVVNDSSYPYHYEEFMPYLPNKSLQPTREPALFFRRYISILSSPLG
jgi:hypothetical protein